MVPIMSLWLPILLSAVIVFVVSSIVHMVLPFHKNDWKRLPNEDAVQEALRRLSIPPGDYLAPRPTSRQGMKDPQFVAKMNAGPVLIMTVKPAGPPSMGKSLGLWFGYLIVVGVFAAYVSGRALAPGTRYPEVFRFAGCTAFSRLLARAAPEFDLVLAQLGRHAAECCRRTAVWAADGRNIRLAVASLKTSRSVR